MLAPWADLLYFADARWWPWHRERPEFQAFRGRQVTIEDSRGQCDDPAVWLLHNQAAHEGALSERRNALTTGQNGGYQAINLAYLVGARRIVLLGYDMQAAPDGRTNWHAGHPIKTPISVFSGMLQCFPPLAAALRAKGIECVNCSPGSALKCFPAHELARVLADPGESVLPA